MYNKGKIKEIHMNLHFVGTCAEIRLLSTDVAVKRKEKLSKQLICSDISNIYRPVNDIVPPEELTSVVVCLVALDEI